MASNGHSNTHPPVASLTDPKAVFYNRLLTRTFVNACLCEDCARDHYLNYPYSCYLNHPPNEIPILPGQRPTIIFNSRMRRYEALQLVRSSIQYFSRPRKELDIGQIRSATEIQEWLYHRDLIARLGSHDTRGTLTVDDMRALIKHLLCVFFFGAIIPFDFAWHSHYLETNVNWIGVTVTENRNGEDVQCIAMHPTKVVMSGSPSRDFTRALAMQRLSTLMHELIHAVILALCCRACRAANDNLAHHGRAWQRLALGVEAQFASLFGLSLDLGRMDGAFHDMKNAGAKFHYPSRHDLEVFGFVEPRRVGTDMPGGG